MLSQNGTTHLIRILGCLPANAKLDLDVSKNEMQNEERIVLHLSNVTKLKVITILSQVKPLDRSRLEKEMAHYDEYFPTIV